jgi:hypothetical protein
LGGRTISSASADFFGLASDVSETWLPYQTPTPCAVNTATATSTHFQKRETGAFRPPSVAASASGTSCHCTGKRLRARCRRR